MKEIVKVNKKGEEYTVQKAENGKEWISLHKKGLIIGGTVALTLLTGGVALAVIGAKANADSDDESVYDTDFVDDDFDDSYEESEEE